MGIYRTRNQIFNEKLVLDFAKGLVVFKIVYSMRSFIYYISSFLVHFSEFLKTISKKKMFRLELSLM